MIIQTNKNMKKIIAFSVLIIATIFIGFAVKHIIDLTNQGLINWNS